MPGLCGPREPDPNAPDPEHPATAARSVSSEFFERRLAAVEKKLFGDIEPRLADVEIDKAVEAFVLARDVGKFDEENVRRDRSQQKRTMLTHAQPTTFGKRNSVEDRLEQAKKEIKSELRDELVAFLREELRTSVDELKAQLQGPEHTKPELIPFTPPSGFEQDALASSIDSQLANESEIVGTIFDRGTQRFDRVLHALPTYTMCESIWDLAWFIGLDALGKGGSVMVSILYVLNLLIQVSFVIICHRNFTENNFSDSAVRGLQDFRLASHDHRFTSRLFDKSLIEQICHENPVYAQNMMVYASRQLDVLNTVNDYLDRENNGFVNLFSGQYMCVLALVCWTLSVQSQLTSIWSALAALICIPRERRTIITITADVVELQALGWRRFAFIVTVLLQEFLICIFLLIYGSIWLSNTSSIQELLLNAVALEFVLSVDDMIFDALAPRPGQAFIGRLAPLPQQGWDAIEGVDRLSVVSTMVLPAVVAFFYFYLVRPMVTQMKSAVSALCDYELGFTYGMDTNSLLWVTTRNHSMDRNAPVTYRPGRWGNDKRNRLQAAARQSIHDFLMYPKKTNTSLILLLPLPGTAIWSIQMMVDADSTSYSNLLNEQCLDIADHPAFSLAHYLRVVSGNFSISGCRDVVAMGLCSDFANPAIALCSASCGCTQPDSVVFSHKPPRGCPTTCLRKDRYKSAVISLRPTCTDLNASSLQRARFWQSWRRQIVTLLDQPWVWNLSKQMATLGCNFILVSNMSSAYADGGFLMTARDWCEGETAFEMRPLSPICPETCQCSTRHVAYCSPTCTGSDNLR